MRFPAKRFALFIILLILLYPFAYFVIIYAQSYEVLHEGKEYQPFLSTKIYDRNGEQISELFHENRTYLPIDKIPAHIKQAFMAAEDQNFYRHSGIDILSILRALMVDIFSGEIKQGGSTITQQLVKQLHTGGEKSIRRKILEVVIAGEFEKRYTKEHILEMYLNQVYFGHGAYGIQAAAQFYFDKEVSDLNIIEASILASIPSAPNRYSPLKKPHRAYEKNKQVLFNLIASGALTKEDAAEAFTRYWPAFLEKIRTRYPTLSVRNKRFDKAPYFTESVRRALIRRYGEETVYRGGLQVYTTLDLRQQEIARQALKNGLLRQNRIAAAHNRFRMKGIDRLLIRQSKLHSGKEMKARSTFLKEFRETGLAETGELLSALFNLENVGSAIENHLEAYEQFIQASRVEGAIVAIDLRKGGISVMIGGGDFNQGNQLNRAVQSRRQPGSAFKAFVYGAGIESKRITAATAFLDAPVIFRGTRTVWTPSNYGKSFRGRVLVRRALASSLNIVSVLVYERIGGDCIADFSSRLMNIPKSRFAVDPTLALGTTELTPLEMARGFAVLANKGREVVPYTIRYVLDRRGKKIYDGERYIQRKKKKQITSPEVAFIMTHLLRGVVDYGTASVALRKQCGFRLPAAGKTGTNSEFRDAWFVGYTPDLVAAVWVGCDIPRFTLGSGQAGAVAAAPIWGAFMQEVYQTRKPSRFSGPPAGVTHRPVCSKTGLLPVDGCPVRGEYFIAGTTPNEQCHSDHNDLISVFDLAKRRKSELIEKERNKIKHNVNETP